MTFLPTKLSVATIAVTASLVIGGTILAIRAAPDYDPTTKPVIALSLVPSAPITPVAEEVLVERARAALGEGDAHSALFAVSEHETSYARGTLREEREALAIEALVMAGKVASANQRMAQFINDFPSSSYRSHLRSLFGQQDARQ